MTEFEPRRAFEHIDKLAYEIGPRLAGTRGDRMAAEYIQTQFKSYGLKPQVHSFKFVDGSAKMRATACLFTAAFVASLFLMPELSILTWLIALIAWRSLGRIMPKRESQNIIAVQDVEAPQKKIAITAHYDSARCMVNYRLHILLKFVFLPAILATFTILALHAIRFIPAWPVVWGILAFVFIPICVGMFVAASGRKISPGANDNASGTAVMLEVARVFAESPPPDVELMFIAFGAEEHGLVGASKLVKEKFLPRDSLVLNLDTVGVGSQVYTIEGNGILRKRKTSARLNQALADSIQRVGLKPKLWWAPIAKHDHMPLLQENVHATTLSIDTPGVDKLGRRISKLFRIPNARGRGYRYLHTPDDTPDRVELSNIERVGNVVIDFVKTIGPVKSGAVEKS